jgi:hypothetical protein
MDDAGRGLRRDRARHTRLGLALEIADLRLKLAQAQFLHGRILRRRRHRDAAEHQRRQHRPQDLRTHATSPPR